MKRFVLAAVLALSASVAQATLMVNVGGVVQNGQLVGGTNYVDNQPGVDSNLNPGILDIGTFLNGSTVNFTIRGFTADSGSPIASLSMNSNSLLAPSALLPLTFNIAVSDTGFRLPATPLELSQTVNLLSSVGGITGSATATGYYGASNTDFDVSGAHTSLATASVAGGVGTNAVGLTGVSGGISGPTPYSLTSVIQLVVTQRGSDPIQNLQLNANLAASGVPEPGTLGMLGAGLMLVAGRIRLYI